MLGTHELERILGREFVIEMVQSLEEYIARSKALRPIQSPLKSPSFSVDTMYDRIVNLKQIDTDTAFHKTFIEPNLKRSLSLIRSYNAVVRDMEEAVISFDPEDKDHQSMLFQFWNIMDPLTVHSNLNDPVQCIEFEHNESKDTESTNTFIPSIQHKAWELLGFQGEKPWTDFRGVGALGLRQMVYFGTNYQDHSRRLLSYCFQFGQMKCYSFAITGISITFDVMNWFRTRRAAPFFYRCIENGNSEFKHFDAVHLLYCRSFVEFHRIWESNPPETVMGYSLIHDAFIKQMEEKFDRNEVAVIPQ